MDNFSEVVKQRMTELNINATELSTSTGISKQHIGNLTKGNRRWNDTLKTKVCKALGITIEYKFSKKEQSNGR